MRKIAYIIPGFTEKTSDAPYPQIASWFKERGIEPIFVDISWNLKAEVTAMSLYVKEFKVVYEKTHQKDDEIYIFGFSFGAMVAYISSELIKPHTLILASVSPFFKEDIKENHEAWVRKLSKANVVSKKVYSFNAIAKKLSARTFVMVGDREVGGMFERALEASRKIKNSYLVISKGAPHRIANKKYLDTLKNLISLF